MNSSWFRVCRYWRERKREAVPYPTVTQVALTDWNPFFVRPSFSACWRRKPIIMILQGPFRFYQHWGQGTKVTTCKTARKKGIWDFRKASFHQLMSYCLSAKLSQLNVFMLPSLLAVKMHSFSTASLQPGPVHTMVWAIWFNISSGDTRADEQWSIKK